MLNDYWWICLIIALSVPDLEIAVSFLIIPSLHSSTSHRTNVVMNYSEVEAKVREATNDDTWGPHGSLMSEISKYTFTYEHYPEVMSMLWKRMFETKKNWRRTYKVRKRGLQCDHGSQMWVSVCWEIQDVHSVFMLSLNSYCCTSVCTHLILPTPSSSSSSFLTSSTIPPPSHSPSHATFTTVPLTTPLPCLQWFWACGDKRSRAHLWHESSRGVCLPRWTWQGSGPQWWAVGGEVR